MIERLLVEMRRRKVLRIAGAYTVAGWVVLQVAETLMPALGLPPWTLTFVAVLLLMGLPFCMVLVWALERMPAAGGGDASPGTAELPGRGRAWLVDAGLLVAVVAVVAVSTVQLVAVRSGDEPTAAAPAATEPASVAVLPFASFSDDSEDHYFADGLSEELINTLAQLPGLKVPGRTSSFHFKGRNEDLRDIGRALGVAHVVEGSVRRAGDQLRVTVQLISTGDGFHLWSRTYDRQLTDVFAIQHDIARQVAATLKVTLLDGEAGGTPAADGSYPSFLIATALLRERTRESLTEARRLFEQILEREPDHVDALAGYAEATIFLAGAYLAIDFEPAAAVAVDAVERAVRLDPDSVVANRAAGTVYDVLAFRSDERHYLAQAERALSRALDLAPNDPEVLRTYGGLLAELGRFELALDVTQRAAELDPLNRAARFQLAETLRRLGRQGDARTELERLLGREPGYVAARLELGELLVETGALEAALPHLEQAHRTRTSPRATFALAHLYLNLGMLDAMYRTLAELDYAPLSLPLADMARHLLSGDDAAALAFATAELARTNDRIWRPVVVLLALNTGNLPVAREQLRRLEPAVLAPEPDVARMAPSTVLLAAHLLAREGRAADSSRLLDALLARFAAPAGGFDPIGSKLIRAQALAEQGRTDDAMAELTAARLQGFRTPFDFDYFLRLDRYPAFQGMRKEPRFQDFLATMEAENRSIAARLAKS